MKDAYIIQGGTPLKGEVKLSGAKNVALKVIIASLLFDSDISLLNIPRIGDVEALIGMLKQVGVEIKFSGKNEIELKKDSIKDYQIDLYSAAKIRVSFMLFAPLLFRFGRAKIPNPGGCRIGQRPIDRQIEAIRQFGVDVHYNSADGYYHAKLVSDKLKGARVKFAKKTHTGTEFAIMLGCLAQGETVIDNASKEPEIDDLISFLNQAGAKIKRKGEKIYLVGVESLRQKHKYKIISDRNEAVTYAIFALGTKGEVSVGEINPAVIKGFIDKVIEAGGLVDIGEKKVRFTWQESLSSTNVTTAPYPGFMTDWQAPWAVLMTQVSGVSTIHETVFEDRFSYVEELKKLGAKIEFFRPKVDNPQKVYQFNLGKRKKEPQAASAIKIYGKTNFHNGILQVSDLRAGASLLIAASIAPGQSVVHGASVIDRGYQNIDKKLQSLGGEIKKI